MVLADLAALRSRFPKVELPDRVLDGFRRPPASPADCIFSQTTACFSADLKTSISPCQFGGRPVCSECGCVASAALVAIGRYQLAGLVKVGDIFSWSHRFGRRFGGTHPSREEAPSSPEAVN
jgi:hypothetical protein